MMRVLIVGGGAREHALAWRLSQDDGVEVIGAPGNAGIAAIGRTVPIDPTDADPEYPIGDEGQRVGWSYEVLPSHRARRHTETEFAVPLGESLTCLDEVVALLGREFPDLRWPIEYRTVAADDVWLSPADGREIATISIHQGVDADDGPLFAACEEIFRRYDGRPHWGKLHGYDAAALAAAHPHWRDWWEQRDAVDPDGVFLNEVLAAWRP